MVVLLRREFSKLLVQPFLGPGNFNDLQIFPIFLIYHIHVIIVHRHRDELLVVTVQAPSVCTHLHNVLLSQDREHFARYAGQ